MRALPLLINTRTLWLALALAAGLIHGAPRLPPEGLADCIHPWKNSHHPTDYPRLAEEDVRGIADDILVYQRANGGWPGPLWHQAKMKGFPPKRV